MAPDDCSAMPEHIDPAARSHVTGDVQFKESSVWLYAAPTNPFGRVVVPTMQTPCESSGRIGRRVTCAWSTPIAKSRPASLI